MTAVVTFAGTTLPDAFVGVPYLAGLPLSYGTSSNVTKTSFSGLPPGLTINAQGLVSGTVVVLSQSESQVDGLYTASVLLTDSGATAVSSTVTINVHYLQADQDLTVAAQAALRAGEEIDNTSDTTGGVTDVGVFPTAPAVPTDIG
jgi:hypothetical protein